MSQQPEREIGINELIRGLDRRERESLVPAASAIAEEFLQAQLRAVESRVRRRRAYQAEEHPEGVTPPHGSAEMMEVYEQERALIEELLRECQGKLLPEVLRERLARAHRRVLELGHPEVISAAAKTERQRARTEREILSELLRRWLAWVKEQGDAPAREPDEETWR